MNEDEALTSEELDYILTAPWDEVVAKYGEKAEQAFTKFVNHE